MKSRRLFDVIAEHAQPRLFPILLFLTRVCLGMILVLGGWMKMIEGLAAPHGWIFMVVGALLVLGLGVRLVGYLVAAWLVAQFVRGLAFLVFDPSALAVALILAASGAGHIWGIDGVLARTKLVERNRILKALIG